MSLTVVTGSQKLRLKTHGLFVMKNEKIYFLHWLCSFVFHIKNSNLFNSMSTPLFEIGQEYTLWERISNEEICNH